MKSKLAFNVIKVTFAIFASVVSTLNLNARSLLTWDLGATELSKWRIEQCENYAAVTNGAKAYSVFPLDNGFGKLKSLVNILDGTSNSSIFIGKRAAKPSKNYQIVIELSEPTKINAFFWTGTLKGQGGYGRSPRSYTVKTSLDGKKWTTVVKQVGTLNKQLHVFTPVVAKYVAMADIFHNKILEIRIIDIGIYNLDLKKNTYSTQDPFWWNNKYDFRLRVKDDLDIKSGGRITRQVNFSDLLQAKIGQPKGMPVQPVDLSSLKMVHCLEQDGKLIQKEYPVEFSKDARFNLGKMAVGNISWTISGACANEGSWWMYLKLLDVKRKAPISEMITYRLNLPVWNYKRGFPIAGTMTLSNNERKSFVGTLAVSLSTNENFVFSNQYPVEIPKGENVDVVFKVPTSNVASGDYNLQFKLTNKLKTTLFKTTAGVTVAHNKKHYMQFACYSWPESNDQACMTWAKRMAAHNVNASFGGRRATSLDISTALGIDFFARGPREGMYPPGPQKVVSAEGNFVNHRWGNTYCPNDPNGLKKMYDMVKKKASELRLLYGSFKGFSCFDDYAFEPATKAKGGPQWTCYCQYCQKRYLDKYGKPMPLLGRPSVEKIKVPTSSRIIKWDSPIVSDDDPALRFIVERCKSVGDYIGNFEKATLEVDTSLKNGLTRQFSAYVGWGEWPPYGFKDAKILSMYDYVSSGCLPLDYLTNYELMQMGNRGKEAWMLMEAVDIFQQLKGRKTISVPYWLVRSEFWHGLAAGYNGIGFFGLALLLKEDTPFSREITKLGLISRKVGPLLSVARPARAEVAILASFPDFAQPDDMKAWRKAFSRISSMHHALLENGIPCEIVADDEVADGYLKNYKVVIVPAVNYLRKSAFDALAKYKGGLFVDERCAIKIPGGLYYSIDRIIIESAIYSSNIPLNTGNPNVVYREFKLNGGSLFVLVNAQAEVSGQLRKYRWGKMKLIDAQPVDCRLKLKNNVFCYDVSRGKLLEASPDNAISVRLAAGGGKLIACYKQPIDSVALKRAFNKVRRGKTAKIKVTIISGGKQSDADYLLELTVIRPDGKLSKEYSRTLLAQNGVANISIPFAINDPIGAWRIEVTEVASSLSKVCTVKLIK